MDLSAPLYSTCFKNTASGESTPTLFTPSTPASIALGNGANAYWGEALALSKDGLTLVASSPSFNSNTGRAWVYGLAAGAWEFQAVLGLSAGATGDLLGEDPSVSDDGSTITLCAPGNPAAVAVYERPAATWGNGGASAVTETCLLQASTRGTGWPASASVSGNGDTVVAGDPNATVSAAALAGKADVFVRPGASWGSGTLSETRTIEAATPEAGAQLGSAARMAKDGSYVALGAQASDAEGVDSGSALVVHKPGSGWEAPAGGGCAVLDGGAYLNASDGSAPALASIQTASFSVSAWVKFDANPGAADIAGNYQSGVGFFIHHQADSAIQFAVGLDTGVVTNSPPTAITYGAWHHIVGTIDMVNRGLTVYIDGVANGSSYSTSVPLATASVEGIRINGSIGRPTTFTGTGNRVDDVSIFSSVLSAAEVTAMYAAGAPGALDLTADTGDYTSSANLQAYWKLDSDGTDSSGKGFNLTAQGTVTYESTGGGGGALNEDAVLSTTAISTAAYLGCSLEISPDSSTLVIAAGYEDTGGTDSGRLYLYTRPGGGTWVSTDETVMLDTSNEAPNDLLGLNRGALSLSLDGTHVACGARSKEVVAPNDGYAYVWKAPDAGWSSLASGTLVTEDAHLPGADLQTFGDCTAIYPDGSSIIVGAPDNSDIAKSGAIFLFDVAYGTNVVGNSGTLTTSGAFASLPAGVTHCTVWGQALVQSDATAVGKQVKLVLQGTTPEAGLTGTTDVDLLSSTLLAVSTGGHTHPVYSTIKVADLQSATWHLARVAADGSDLAGTWECVVTFQPVTPHVHLRHRF